MRDRENVEGTQPSCAFLVRSFPQQDFKVGGNQAVLDGPVQPVAQDPARLEAAIRGEGNAFAAVVVRHTGQVLAIPGVV